ncbi:M50 family metallopeptidase [Bacillus sp. RO1]|uniref:M50 family metallopeptidase n=1 Tax=Bacillus sp. RO1 TaxID=2722703 RepID=UPI0023F7A1D8|nr:M50 family metallopeptidase [Bacillus sp. RO1]
MNNKWLRLVQKIHVHPLMWFLAGLAILTANFRELLILFFIVFIHELGHGIAATHYNWRIKQVLLLPFGGVAEMEEHGNRPLKEELVVTLAGPLQHVWLSAGAFLLFKLGYLSAGMWEMFFTFNIMIFLVNLLPIWPLDGGKIMGLLFSRTSAFAQAHERTLQASFVFLALFCTTYLVIDPLHINIWIITVFLFFSLYTEWKQRHFVFMRFLMERYYGKNNSFSTITPIVVDEKEKIHQVLQKFKRDCKHSIIVMKGKDKQPPLDENELLHAYFKEKLTTIDIGDILYSY